MSARSFLSIAALAVSIPLVLSGCGGGTPTETTGPLEPSSSASGTPTPDATEEPAGPTALPADCAALVATADQSQFGSAPLNDPAFVDQGPSGVVVPEAPAANADARQTMRALHELWCLWADPGSDITHLSVEVGHLDPAAAATLISGLESEGYACSQANGGTQCEIVEPNSQFPVDDEFTYLFRDDVIILVDQTNFPTNGLMASMVQVIWG